MPGDSVRADAEFAVDAVALTKEAPTALKENPNVCGLSFWLRVLRVGSTTDVSKVLFRPQDHQVHSQQLEFLLFVTLCVAVRVTVLRCKHQFGEGSPSLLFLPFLFPLLERFFCANLGQSHLKWPEVLQWWHWSVLDAAAIAAPRPEMGGEDDFLDRSSMWKFVAVCLVWSSSKERSL